MKQTTRLIVYIFIMLGLVTALMLLRQKQKKTASTTPEQNTQVQGYVNKNYGFFIIVPTGYTVDANYQYQSLGPGKEINGVKFTIPQNLATGTNLANDTYISVEKLPGSQDCNAGLFLDNASVQTLTDNNITYSTAFFSGAAAGNRYDETVYAFPANNACYAVRYFIHSGSVQNYPEGTVQEFDKQALLDQFDQARRTLTIK